MSLPQPSSCPSPFHGILSGFCCKLPSSRRPARACLHTKPLRNEPVLAATQLPRVSSQRRSYPGSARSDAATPGQLTATQLPRVSSQQRSYPGSAHSDAATPGQLAVMQLPRVSSQRRSYPGSARRDAATPGQLAVMQLPQVSLQRRSYPGSARSDAATPGQLAATATQTEFPTSRNLVMTQRVDTRLSSAHGLTG